MVSNNGATHKDLPSSDVGKPNIYVIDDDEAVLQSLLALVESRGYTATGFTSGKKFLESFDPTAHGCVITDWRMPELSGMDLLSALKSRGMPLPVIVLTAFADVPMAVGAMRTGAVTVLQKPCSEVDLFAAIDQALDYDRSHRSEALERLQIRDRFERLSTGEREVMNLALAGRMNREIASELGIGLRTVEKRRHNVMQKMQVDSLAELMQAVMSIEHRLPAVPEEPKQKSDG